MNTRTKKQHFIPRFYLEKFANRDRDLWTHDSKQGTLRQSSPENTGFETNIYTPLDAGGNRIELIEDTLAEIESNAAPIYDELLSYRKLDHHSKTHFSIFLASCLQIVLTKEP